MTLLLLFFERWHGAEPECRLVLEPQQELGWELGREQGRELGREQVGPGRRGRTSRELEQQAPAGQPGCGGGRTGTRLDLPHPPWCEGSRHTMRRCRSDRTSCIELMMVDEPQRLSRYSFLFDPQHFSFCSSSQETGIDSSLLKESVPPYIWSYCAHSLGSQHLCGFICDRAAGHGGGHGGGHAGCGGHSKRMLERTGHICPGNICPDGLPAHDCCLAGHICLTDWPPHICPGPI